MPKTEKKRFEISVDARVYDAFDKLCKKGKISKSEYLELCMIKFITEVVDEFEKNKGKEA